MYTFPIRFVETDFIKSGKLRVNCNLCSQYVDCVKVNRIQLILFMFIICNFIYFITIGCSLLCNVVCFSSIYNYVIKYVPP